MKVMDEFAGSDQDQEVVDGKEQERNDGEREPSD